MRVLPFLLGLGLIAVMLSIRPSQEDNHYNREAAFRHYDHFQPSAEDQTGVVDAPSTDGNLFVPTSGIDLVTPTKPEEKTAVVASSVAGSQVVPLPEPQTETTPSSGGQDVGVSKGPTDVVFVTFYYCERTVDRPDDGGGYCHTTRTGTVVHPGTAACDGPNLRRRFVFVHDPNQQVFTCEDTGTNIGPGDIDVWYQTNDEGYGSPLTGTREIIWQD